MSIRRRVPPVVLAALGCSGPAEMPDDPGTGDGADATTTVSEATSSTGSSTTGAEASTSTDSGVPPDDGCGELQITAVPNFEEDLHPPGGVFWNNYEVDIREGVIGWCDGDHGDGSPESNSVRYFNTSDEAFQDIPPGEVGYLEEPAAWGEAKVSEYDNYHWWYAPSDDKFFWIFSSELGTGHQFGVFDLQAGTWTHGNSDYNDYAWPNGPYWSDYVTPETAESHFTLVKNTPNSFCEALDTAVALDSSRFFLIERNPDYPDTMPQPWRIVTPSIDDQPYAIQADRSIGWNQYMNSGICIGEWFYFIRPASPEEKESYPDPRMREFWRVRMVPPYDQSMQLASFPRFDINPVPDVAGMADTGSWGPLLVYDEASRSILAIFDKLWVYDIDEDTWTDRTPAQWQRVLYAVGGMKPSTREIFYRPGNNVDAEWNDSVTRNSWSRLELSCGEKARARWQPGEAAQSPDAGPLVYANREYSLDETGALVRQAVHDPNDRTSIPLPVVADGRTIQRLGHLVVLSPPVHGYDVDDPWLHVWDTNRQRWTEGQSWQQMRADDPTLPAEPSPGAMWTIGETGEIAVHDPEHGGVVTVRVW